MLTKCKKIRVGDPLCNVCALGGYNELRSKCPPDSIMLPPYMPLFTTTIKEGKSNRDGLLCPKGQQ